MTAELSGNQHIPGINAVKKDVADFVFNPKELDIWSNEYFVMLAERIVFK